MGKLFMAIILLSCSGAFAEFECHIVPGQSQGFGVIKDDDNSMKLLVIEDGKLYVTSYRAYGNTVYYSLEGQMVSWPIMTATTSGEDVDLFHGNLPEGNYTAHYDSTHDPLYLQDLLLSEGEGHLAQNGLVYKCSLVR